jgi:hypothetical protein
VIVEREARVGRRSNGTAIALGVLGVVVLFLVLWFLLLDRPATNIGGTRTDDRDAPGETSNESTETESGDQTDVKGEGTLNVETDAGEAEVSGEGSATGSNSLNTDTGSEGAEVSGEGSTTVSSP